MDSNQIEAQIQNEVSLHNELATQIDQAKAELEQRRGRISLLQELLQAAKKEEAPDSPPEEQRVGPNLSAEPVKGEVVPEDDPDPAPNE